MTIMTKRLQRNAGPYLCPLPNSEQDLPVSLKTNFVETMDNRKKISIWIIRKISKRFSLQKERKIKYINKSQIDILSLAFNFPIFCTNARSPLLINLIK